MSQFSVLDQASEDKLHATRLLGIEERPFKRLTKRLLASTTPIQRYLTREPTTITTTKTENDEDKDPDATTEATPDYSQQQQQHTKFLTDLTRFREDVILDFASFDSSIARIQFLRTANERERARYAAEKVKIEETATEVKENMALLKTRLEEAQRTLAVRKGYDVLAEKITRREERENIGESGGGGGSNSVETMVGRLRPRDEQHVAIERLKVEIEELEREGGDLEGAWVERREGLKRVVDEAGRLRRIVRDEKEHDLEEKGEDGSGAEDDDDDNNEDDEDGDGDGDGDGDENMLGRHTRDAASHMGTPRPMLDDAPTPLPGVHESGALTPRSMLAEAEVLTPRPEVDQNKGEGDTEMQEVSARDVVADDGGGNKTAVKADEMDTT